MKRLARCLLLVLPILTGCKGELSVVRINLDADGSGDCEFAGVRDVQYVEQSSPNGDGILKNANDIRTVELRVQQTRAKFSSLDALNVGGITFSTVKEGEMNLVTVRIPVGSDAKWFETFGVSNRSLELWNRLDEEGRKANESRRKADPRATNLAFEPPRPPNVLFEVNLPTKLEGQGIETLPLGLSTKVSTSNGERQAQVSIPLAEIHGNGLKELVWKIRFAAR
jgi:hypothetical protein